ncbi:hypothetical protein OAN99_01770 [Flavobacteriaceae bacterium]|nr:hypothetical protein [Flavobacteriaceae bacterium]
MLFVEQRFNLFDGVLNLTPGVAVNSYSDFGLFAYPGLDLGLNLSPQWLLYGNLGYTYRIQLIRIFSMKIGQLLAILTSSLKRRYLKK